VTESPTVLTLLDSYVKGWPEHDDERAGVFPLNEVLTGRYDTDVHFTAYTAAVGRRHTGGSIATLARAEEADVQMVAAVFDVDGPGHQADDAWWLEQRDEKVGHLLDVYFGGFAYRTRGGYRLVFSLPEPFFIHTSADAERWTRTYLAWCTFLEHEYGIVADRRCKEWQRLYRAPHATRDGVLLDFESLGNPNELGLWEIDVNAWAHEEAIEKAIVDAIVSGEGVARVPSPAKSLRDSAAKLIADHWPKSGDRANARMALVGACIHAGWSCEDAADFAKRVHAHVPDRRDATDASLDDMAIKALARKNRGEPIIGWPTLGDYVGHAIVAAAKDWLTQQDPEGQAQFDALINGPKLSTTSNRNEGIFWDNWDEPLPPVKWLVEGLIPQGTVGAFVAHGSSLKTWTMLSIASAVAKGKAWLDKYPVSQGKVVILDYESGRYELRRRVLLLEKGKVVGLGAWSYPSQRIDDVNFWIELGNEEGVVLVCVDSLAEGSSPGVDENSKDAAFPLQLAAKFTEATGASVLFVHHSKKDDSGDARKVVRGSTAIYAALDWCFAFENVADTEGYRRMLMTSIKPCMGAKPPPVPLELTDKGLTMFEVGEKPTKASPPAQIQAAIRLALAGGPVENKAKLAAAIGIRKEIVTPELDAMVVRGEVAFLRLKGYVLDGEEHRRKRVIEAVTNNPHTRNKGTIAKAADVDTQTVDECLENGIIFKSADGRFIVAVR
jgi:hypothetical protein